MTPTDAAHDTADLLLTDAVLHCQLGLQNLPGGVIGSDRQHLLIRQLRHAVALPSIIRQDATTFSVPVAVVVGIGAQEPVRGVVTPGMVAGVADLEVSGIFAEGQQISHSDGKFCLTLMADLPTSVAEDSPNPGPAFVCSSSINICAVPDSDGDAIVGHERREYSLR